MVYDGNALGYDMIITSCFSVGLIYSQDYDDPYTSEEGMLPAVDGRNPANEQQTTK